ncbi:MAG: hypothetical protein ACTTKF_06540 [Bacteroides sp.]
MNFGKYALLALAGVSLLAFTSCKKDDKAKNPPKFVVNDKDGKNITAELTSRTVFPLEIRVTPGDGLKITELTYSVTYDPAAGENKGKIDDLKKVDSHFQGHFAEAKIPTDKTKGTITFKAVDSDKGENTISVKFNFGGATPNPGGNDNPPAETGWTSTTRDGALNHKTSDAHPNAAFDLKAGSGLKIKEEGKEANRYMMNTTKGNNEFKAEFTSDKIDFYNKEGKVESTSKGNGCEFTKVTGLDFDKATATEAAAKFVAGTKTLTVNEGDIVVAKKGDELYLLKITKISKTGGRAGQGYMTFSYKTKK